MTSVLCNTRFIGFHRWPDAPESVKYLRDLHRHEFWVKVFALVKHDNRDIEFQTLKLQVDDLIKQRQPIWPDYMSCEMMAKAILTGLKSMDLPVYSVCVMEDGENGAMVDDDSPAAQEYMESYVK